MKFLLSILILFAAAVALGTLLQNTAYVLLVYPPYRIELSLKLFVALFLLIFVFGYWLMHLFSMATKLPAMVQKLRLDRAQNRARKLMDVTLSAFFEGRYAEAEKAAAKAMDMGERSGLYPIIAARSAHEMAAFDRRDAYLATNDIESQNDFKGDSTLRLLATARFKLDQHDPEGALGTLQSWRERPAKPHHGVLMLELEAHQQTGNWGEVMNILKQLEKRNLIEPAQAEKVRERMREAMARAG